METLTLREAGLLPDAVSDISQWPGKTRMVKTSAVYFGRSDFVTSIHFEPGCYFLITQRGNYETARGVLMHEPVPHVWNSPYNILQSIKKSLGF